MEPIKFLYMHCKEISRTPLDATNSIVERVKDGTWQVLKETTETTGETASEESELLTTETITITRRIGIKQPF